MRRKARQIARLSHNFFSVTNDISRFFAPLALSHFILQLTAFAVSGHLVQCEFL